METPVRGREGSAAEAGCWPALRPPLSLCGPDDDLNVRYDGDTSTSRRPMLHFLTGKPLERLKDGAAVAYVGSSTC